MARPRRERDVRGSEWIAPAAKIFFVNNQLVRVLKQSRSAGTVKLWNMTLDREQFMLYDDFHKHRKRAYPPVVVGRLLGKGPAQMYRYINAGLIKPPLGEVPGGERHWGKKSYYSEEDVFEIREALANGRRKMLTERDLRGKMGDAIVLYTKTSDGRFIPVWAENTY